MSPISIIITDDHRLVRESLSSIFKADNRFNVVNLCCDGIEVVKAAEILKPDIILMDINMPGINGLEAARQIRFLSPTSKIVGLSVNANPDSIRKMLLDGVNGYVSKNSPAEELIYAVIEIFNNRKYICNEIKDILSTQFMEGNDPYAALKKMSKKEIQIIYLLKKGYTSKEISSELKIPFNRVEFHRFTILKKAKVQNIAELINYINKAQFILNYPYDNK